jgi:sigma-B regulation protein RsbU (phosphoserine phosphatase)
MDNQESFRIMLVEDSPTAAELANYWLVDGLRSEFVLHRATDLSSALELLRQRIVDLTILDLNLSDSQGLATFRAIHAQDRRVPIVVLSGDADETLAIEAVRLGAQDYVVKNNGVENPLARPVRFAWERVQRYRAEAALRENNQQLQIARSVQQYLFPDGPPTLPGYDIAYRCEPTDMIGGDYYDFVPLPDGSVGLAIADVSGHGTAAALLMVEVRATLRALMGQGLNLGEIMRVTNDLLTPDLDHNFVTAFFAILQPKARILRYGSAAHPALLIRADGTVHRLEAQTPPLGVHVGVSEISDEIKLSNGDLLVLYTDGLVERLNPENELFGLNRMVEVLKCHCHQSAEEIVECVLLAVRAFSGGVPQADDETLVIVKVGSEC